MVVTRIGVWSVGRMYGALSAAMGLLFGLILALASLAGASFGNQDAPAWFAPVFGVGAIVALPILYGLMGLVVGAVTAVLYNIFAKLVGGVVLETE